MKTWQRNLILFLVCLAGWIFSFLFLLRLGHLPSLWHILPLSISFSGMLVSGIQTWVAWRKGEPAR